MQLVRKARLGCDAILPGNTPSQLWQDDELVDLLNEANDEVNQQLRLLRKNYGLQTVKYGDVAFTRAGVTYAPTTELAIATGATSFSLPPDFATISRILCTDNTTVRFVPAEYNSQYWIDMEQGARNTDGTFTSINSSLGQTMFYDITGKRTLRMTPPAPSSMQLSVDYIPVKRSLFYSTAGTVTLTQGSTTGVVNGGSLATDGIYADDTGQTAEIIVGFNDLANTALRLDREYPVISAITDDGHLTLSVAWPGNTVTNAKYIAAMAPTAPADTHRWIASLVAAFMLRKVSPDLAQKYAADVMARFTSSVKPATSVRQEQDSRVTDDNSLLGGLADF